MTHMCVSWCVCTGMGMGETGTKTEVCWPKIPSPSPCPFLQGKRRGTGTQQG